MTALVRSVLADARAALEAVPEDVPGAVVRARLCGRIDVLLDQVEEERDAVDDLLSGVEGSLREAGKRG